jgi:non-specific serine/threonine protein kinase
MRAFFGHKHFLLVLDNLEQVIEAAPVVADLLADCPNLNVLVTSRMRLRLDGEHEFAVSPLPVTTATPNAIPDAIRLFVARTRAVVPAFTLTPQHTPAVTEICLRLDGLPLAIELAAAWVKVLPPPALLARLERRLPLLTGGSRGVPGRQQTMRDTLAWSHDLLTPAEQALFRRLGVFVGGFTIDAAEAVAVPSGDPGLHVLDGVMSLVDQSLLAQRAEPDTNPRFFMLETVREAALERLATSGEEEEVRARHAAHFLALGELANRERISPKHRAWGARLEAEHANLRSVFEWAANRRDVDCAQRLIAGVGVYFGGIRGQFVEVGGWTDRALALGVSTLPGVYIEVLIVASEVATQLGSLEQAVSLSQQAVTRARAEGGDTATGWALLHLANAVANNGGHCGRLDSVPMYEEALALLDSPDGWGISSPVMYNLAGALMETDIDRSEALASEALARWRVMDIPWGIGRALNLLAEIAQIRGDRPRAITLSKQALRVHWESHDAIGLIQALYAITATLDASHDGAGVAARLAGTADAKAEEIGWILSLDYRQELDRDLEPFRATLGDEAFTEAHAAGRMMTTDEAVTVALAPQAPISAPPPAIAAPFDLTVREREVLSLLAEGRSDREIAGTLSISYRTVTSHVRNILDKLDVSSRTAAATLAVRRDLV